MKIRVAILVSFLLVILASASWAEGPTPRVEVSVPSGWINPVLGKEYCPIAVGFTDEEDYWIPFNTATMDQRFSSPILDDGRGNAYMMGGYYPYYGKCFSFYIVPGVDETRDQLTVDVRVVDPLHLYDWVACVSGPNGYLPDPVFDTDGKFTITVPSWTELDYSSSLMTGTRIDINAIATPVPEPNSLIYLVTAIGGCLICRLRYRR